MLGFSEWLEVHALASNKTGKSYDVLLQSLKVKFQWVLNQAKRLGLPSPPKLTTFRLTAEDKKRKRASKGSEDQLSAKHQLMIKGLADGKASVSNLKDIQVKDIVKEVKDYLKTYSPAEMDIR
ncbi:hypothetical protein Tco_0939966 [Tanacetum coccineum]|uniref:Uncharacterized protein n=1 Tax=Tanacetum coccineum TaxID=301880 RepID=A0ABQ5DLM3_9ASTR